MACVAYIGLGGNLGDRAGYLRDACRRLGASPDLTLLRASAVYETDPVGPDGQEAYYNAVIEVETRLEPPALVARCKAVEAEIGRTSTVRWGPREIDLDLLFFDARILHTDTVHVPHPEAHRRGFVLEPLAELNPDLVHPELGRTVADLLAALPRPTGVRGVVSDIPPLGSE